MNSYKTPPQIGDRIIISDWVQFETTVNCVEELPDKRVCIHVTTKYPENDPFFTRKSETSKVYLHDEGKVWCRYDSHPMVN